MGFVLRNDTRHLSTWHKYLEGSWTSRSCGRRIKVLGSWHRANYVVPKTPVQVREETASNGASQMANVEAALARGPFPSVPPVPRGFGGLSHRN